MKFGKYWFAVLPALYSALALANPEKPLSVTSPCENSEHWYFNESIPEEARNEFASLLAGRSSAARSLSEALAFRRDAALGESRAFSEYWIARSLLFGGLPHSAYAGFASIVMRKRTSNPENESLSISLAALRCMSTLVQKYPSLELPDSLADRLSESPSADMPEAALLLLKQQLQNNRSKEHIKRTVSLFKGTSPADHWVRGVWATLNGDHRNTATELERFLASASGATQPLARHSDQAHLLAARAYYAMGDFTKASHHLRLVRKASNDLPEALSELAWASLNARTYGDAIGAAINLQSGGLRRVFAPEGPMVLAMALNELCQYPEALRALEQFRKAYAPSYRWLSEWSRQAPESRDNLYSAAIAFLGKKRIQVPERIASEWLRSPVFIASQEELNLLSTENTALTRMSHAGSRETKALGQELKKVARGIIPRLKAERISGKPLSQALRNDLATLLSQLNHYRRLRAAGPLWRAIAANHKVAATALRTNSMDRITRDLTRRNFVMLTKLEEIAENNRLIEVEIFDGASQDLIWQNAHPDYRRLVNSIKEEHNRVAGAQVWMWGRSPIHSSDWSEVWEDELGALKSNIFNNCSNKEKYLAIKARMNQQQAISQKTNEQKS